MNCKDSVKKIEKIFPEYFNRFVMPEGVKEEAISVYRACRSGKSDRDSFLPSFEESGFRLHPLADSTDPGQYSLSTYEKPTDIKRYANVMSDMKVPYKIALGKTEPQHGVVQRTRERTKRRTSHVDWWLYKDATPYDEFSIIEDFEDHLLQYKKQREAEQG